MIPIDIRFQCRFLLRAPLGLAFQSLSAASKDGLCHEDRPGKRVYKAKLGGAKLEEKLDRAAEKASSQIKVPLELQLASLLLSADPWCWHV